jgi:hypothetical protein
VEMAQLSIIIQVVRQHVHFYDAYFGLNYLS